MTLPCGRLLPVPDTVARECLCFHCAVPTWPALALLRSPSSLFCFFPAQVYAWGNGEFGRCGNGNSDEPVPVPVDLLKDFKFVQVRRPLGC